MRRRTLLTILVVAMSLICAMLVILVIYLLKPAPPEEQTRKDAPAATQMVVYDYYAGYAIQYERGDGGYARDANGQLKPVLDGQGQAAPLKDDFGNFITWGQFAIELVQGTQVSKPVDVKALLAYQKQRAQAEGWSKREDLRDLQKRLKPIKDVDDLDEALAWSEGQDAPKPSVGEITIKGLVDGGYLESELDMDFLKVRLDHTGRILWRVQHLDLDRPDAEKNNPDPYFEVYLEYFDEQVSFGPAWVVNVATGQVVPRNDYARLFERSTEAPEQIDGLNRQLTQVVKALTNTQFTNGLQLGSFLLQRFVKDHKACIEERDGSDDASAYACDEDQIIGWTIDHLFADEYSAYFQWVENGEQKIARWDVTMKEQEGGGEGLPSIEFVPRGLLAIELMQSAETFCVGELIAGKKSDETEVDICQDVVSIDACPSAFNRGEFCNPADVGHCCVMKDGKAELAVDPASPEALARLNGVHKALLIGEPVGDYLVKVGKASETGEIGPLSELFGARQGPLWPKTFDTASEFWKQDVWHKIQSGAEGRIAEDPSSKPGQIIKLSLYEAFASVLSEGDFVTAAQQLLSSQDGFTIAPDACDALEGRIRMRLVDAGKGSADVDVDGVSNEGDTCVRVADPDQTRRFASQRLGARLEGDALEAAVASAAGDACACRWNPKPERFGEGEGVDGPLRVAYRILYQYRDGEESKGVGFFVVAPPFQFEADKVAEDELALQKWALRHKEKLRKHEEAFLASAGEEKTRDRLAGRYIIPIGDLSEWAFWSVNPRNLKGRQKRARALMPPAALKPPAPPAPAASK